MDNTDHGQNMDLIRAAVDITVAALQRGTPVPATTTVPALFKAVFAAVQDVYRQQGEPQTK